jgi:predicted enzyme related to lactoylglutathione lyase
MEGLTMGQPVVHFEIIGSDPAKLRSYYGELFDWAFQIGDATTETVSQPGNYGFVDGATTGGGINGGVGGGDGFEGRVVFYVGVSNVEAALERAERLGGKRKMGPEGTPGTLVVGQFTDPEGNLVGVAGLE